MTAPTLEAQVAQMLPQVARADDDTKTLDEGKLIGAKQYRALVLPAVLRALQAERDHAEELRGVLTITREQRDDQATTIAALQAENARLRQALESPGFDYGRGIIRHSGFEIKLSPHEADIFQVLSKASAVVSASSLIAQVYGMHAPEYAEVSIRVTIHSLRKKLKAIGMEIICRSGFGYDLRKARAALVGEK